MLREGGGSDIRVLEEGDEMQNEPKVPEARGLLGGWGQEPELCLLYFCLTSHTFANE